MNDKDSSVSFRHSRHSCGHAVYWIDAEAAMLAESSPCPWCGGETGDKVSADMNLMYDPGTGIVIFKEMLPNGGGAMARRGAAAGWRRVLSPQDGQYMLRPLTALPPKSD